MPRSAVRYACSATSRTARAGKRATSNGHLQDNLLQPMPDCSVEEKPKAEDQKWQAATVKQLALKCAHWPVSVLPKETRPCKLEVTKESILPDSLKTPRPAVQTRCKHHTSLHCTNASTSNKDPNQRWSPGARPWKPCSAECEMASKKGSHGQPLQT